MSVAYNRPPPSARQGSAQKSVGSSSLADVLNIILDKGIVIDAWVRLSVVGIEILTLEARVVVASVDTYLRYAEAIGLTPLASAPPDGQAQRQNGQHQQADHGPSEDQVMGYLSDHPDGVRIGELQAYFDAPRDDLADILHQLMDEDKVRRDDEQRSYMPAKSQNGNQQQ